MQGFRLFLTCVWEPFEIEFQPIEERFINHIDIIVRLANVEHQILYKRETQGNQGGSHIYTGHIVQQLTMDIDRTRREILQWLSQDDFEETHIRHYNKRCENTGQWLLDDSRLISWQDDVESSLLWCHGARK